MRREVTRVVTPGTVTDEALFDPRQSNYLAAVAPGDPAGVALRTAKRAVHRLVRGGDC